MTDPAKKPSPLFVYSAIAAVVMILFTLATWWGGPSAFIGRAGYIKFILIIGIGLMAAVTARRQHGNYLEFRQALRVCFGVMVVGMAVQTLFAWGLLAIDTKFKAQLMPLLAAQSEATMRAAKYPDDEIARNLAELKVGDPFSFGRMLAGLAWIYIILFLVSLGLAAVIGQRKK
jgi:hypothetical protein